MRACRVKRQPTKSVRKAAWATMVRTRAVFAKCASLAISLPRGGQSAGQQLATHRRRASIARRCKSSLSSVPPFPLPPLFRVLLRETPFLPCSLSVLPLPYELPGLTLLCGVESMMVYVGPAGRRATLRDGSRLGLGSTQHDHMPQHDRREPPACMDCLAWDNMARVNEQRRGSAATCYAYSVCSRSALVSTALLPIIAEHLQKQVSDSDREPCFGRCSCPERDRGPSRAQQPEAKPEPQPEPYSNPDLSTDHRTQPI